MLNARAPSKMIGLMLLSVAMASPAKAAADYTYVYSGQCVRLQKPPENAVLTLYMSFAPGQPTAVRGGINGKQLSNVFMQDKDIRFDVPGLFKDEMVIRHFVGKITTTQVQGSLSQDDGKVATCSLQGGSQ